jgi:hypothetical protein
MLMTRARLALVHIPPPRAEANLAQLRRMAVARYDATKDEHAVIIEALLNGARQSEVARAIGRSREHVRKVYDRWITEAHASAS